MGLGIGHRIGAQGRPPPVGATPATILANIAHWYRADSANVTRDGSNNVSQWNDLVGSAHLVQATGANKPTYVASDAGYNNQPLIQASAAGKFLAAASVAMTQPFTLWVVGEFPDSGNLFCVNLSGAYLGVNSNTLYAYAGSALLSSGVSGTTKRAIKATFAGASSKIGADNWVGGGATGNPGAGNGTAISVFTSLGGSAGKVAEAAFQNGISTSGEDAAMAAYYLDRYAINVT